MKQIKIFGLALNVLLVMTSCATKCPDFDKSILDWMPNKANDKIVLYKDNSIDTLLVNYSQVDHSDKIAFGVKCSCQNAYLLKLSSDSITIRVYFNDSRNIENSSIEFDDGSLGYSGQLDTLTLAGQSYTDLAVFEEHNHIYYQRYNKVILSKSIGIISISGVNDHWSIQGNKTQ